MTDRPNPPALDPETVAAAIDRYTVVDDFDTVVNGVRRGGQRRFLTGGDPCYPGRDGRSRRAPRGAAYRGAVRCR